MDKVLKLSSSINKEIALNNGFKFVRKSKYSLIRYLYKDSIYLFMTIDLKEKSVEWEVIDKFKNAAYMPFYNNTSDKNNLVAIEVIDKYEKQIKNLIRSKILKGEKVGK